jgi:C-terminal peptidase prc
MSNDPPTVTTQGSPELPAAPVARRGGADTRTRLLGGLVLLLILLGYRGGSGLTPTPIAHPSPTPDNPLDVTIPRPDTRPGTFRPPAVMTALADATPLPWHPMTPGQRVAVFQQAWELVRDRYVYVDYHGQDWIAVHDEFLPKVESESDTPAFYDLMRALIDRLDDGHSRFADPDEASWEDAHQQAADEPVGDMGLFGAMLGEAFRVLEVAPGSPAAQAGIRRGDILRAVDGIPITNEDDAIFFLSGLPGDMSILLIQTPGQAARHVHVTRVAAEYVLQPQALIWPGTHIAYLDLPTFDHDGIANKVHDQLALLTAERIDGLIIDLRENGGGLIREMRDTLALFINGGQIGYEATRRSGYPITLPRGQQLASLVRKPIVILIDHGSGSAAEVFAAAMRYRGAGIALGTNSAGNVEAVYPHDLLGGTRLYLAEARYLLADGTSLEGIGVHPDILLDVPWYDHPPEEDPQVLTAIQYIQRHH